MKFNLLLILLALLIANSYCHGQSPSINVVNADLLRRFDSEAPKAWQESKEDYLRFASNKSRQCDVILVSSQLPSVEKRNPEKSLEHRSLYLNRGEDYGVLKGGLEDGNTNETVALFNRSYYALLQRKKGSSDWLLKNMGEVPEHDSEMPFPEALGEINISLFHAANPLSSSIHPYDENPFIREHAGQETARAWPDLRDREIISIEFVDYEGREMIRVVMTFNVKAIDWGSSVNNRYRSIDQPWKYTAIFDPANHWCLREVAGGVVKAGKIVNENKRNYSYTEVNGVQICDSYSETATWKNTTKIKLVERTNAVTKVSLSPEDFTLSAFGLPEPSWYRPPTPWWMYTAFAGWHW